MIEANYGAEAGALLWSEKECEDKWDSTNTVDQMHMEPYTSDNFPEEAKPLAYQNQTQIERNIPRLVRIVRRDEMRAKMQKDFKDTANKNGEVAQFLEVYRRMKKLWILKLCTSLEEYVRNQEQLQVSKKRVSELEDQLMKKTTDLDTFTNKAKDSKEQRNKEIDDLKQTQ